MFHNASQDLYNNNPPTTPNPTITNLIRKVKTFHSKSTKTKKSIQNFFESPKLPHRSLFTTSSTSSFLPRKQSTDHHKKVLVLDLDNTLVCSNSTSFTDHPHQNTINIALPHEQAKTIYFITRPYLDEFFKTTSELYEIVIFTASVEHYAKPLIDVIDTMNVCGHRLYRDKCTVVNGNYVKDLKRLGRDLKDVIIIDDSAYSFSFNKHNGLAIKSFQGEHNDTELQKLIPLLKYLYTQSDVTEVIKVITTTNNEIDYTKVNALISSTYNKCTTTVTTTATSSSSSSSTH